MKSFLNDDEDPDISINESNYNYSEDTDALTEYESVDEGAVAVLTIDEIKNMKNLQINYQ